MDQKQQTNGKSIWLWAAIGFFLPFLVFLFLRSSQLGRQSYYDPLIHSLLLLTVCGLAFYVAYAALRGYKESQAVNLFITGLAFYTFGFVFFLHGIAVPDIGLFTEAFFGVTEHYSLFLGSLILLGLILPSEGLREVLYQHRVKIFFGWAVFLLATFITLVLFPPLTEMLERLVDLFIGMTVLLIIVTLIFMLISYQRNRSSLLFYLIIGLAILVNSAIIPFFYREWNFLWWYFHFTFLLPFLIISLCFLRYRHKKEEVVKALAKTPLYKTLGSKLLVVFLLIGLLPLSIFGFLNIQSSKADLEKEITNKLLLLAEAKEGQVFTYLNSLELRTTDFSSDDFIRDGLKTIVNTGSKEAGAALSEYLIRNKQSLDPIIIGILVVDLNGKVVAATDEKEIGEDESDDSYFIEGKKGVFITELYEMKHFGLDYIFVVSTPLTDKVTKEPLGVLMNFFDPEKLRNILSGEFQIEKGAISGERGHTKTLETYIVNREKKMLVYPHRMGQGKKEHEAYYKEIVVDTPPVKKCLKDKQEISAVYFNYAQKEVIGASMCITQKGWTLVAEISIEEALVPIREMQLRLILIALLFAALVSGLALVFAEAIANPIKKLHRGAAIISGGDFGYRVNVKTGDELEQLAGEFNSMAGKLASFYWELETKIQKRTKELDAANQRLRASEQQLRAGNQQLRAASQTLIEERATLEIRVKARTKELSQAYGQMRSLLESTKLGIMMIDLNYDVVLANSAARFIFGKFPSEPITFKELQEKLKNVNLSRALSFYVKDAKPFNIKEILIEGKYYHIFLSPVRDIEEKIFLGALIVLEDITKQKAIEKMRSEIISITSHQLRTPLSVIKGNLEMVLGGDAGKITKEQKEILKEAFLGNERMIKLINDLMDVSKIDEGKFKLKLVLTKLEDLLAETVKELLPLAEEKKVLLSFNPPPAVLPKVNIDPQRIKQVLQNLIDNAIKYSHADSKGRVVVDIEKDEVGKFLKVIVRDNGVGIPKNEQEKIFGRFFRASNVGQLDPGGGTGLGLYIAKAITEQGRGKIWFMSEEGKGTTFYVTLPYQPRYKSM